MGDASSPTYAQDNNHMRKMEMEAYLLSNGDDLMVFRDFEDKRKKETELMSEQTTKKDLEKKILEIIEENTGEDEEITQELLKEEQEAPQAPDLEWYHSTLYTALVKRWAKEE